MSAATLRRVIVLNAFRHQRRNHHTIGSIAARTIQCSTPFGINEGITTTGLTSIAWGVCAQRLSASTKESPFSVGLVGAVAEVLNAFRHQRRNHPSGHRCSAADLECSTPFGINEGITRPQWRCSVSSWCAQRLSASTKESPAVHHPHEWPARQCSTPFGINEGITRSQSSLQAACFQCSTPFGINEGITQLLKKQ